MLQKVEAGKEGVSMKKWVSISTSKVNNNLSKLGNLSVLNSNITSHTTISRKTFAYHRTLFYNR